MVTLRVIAFRMTQDGISFIRVFFLIKRQNGECNVRQILFEASPDVLAFKVRDSTKADITMQIWILSSPSPNN